MTVISYRQALHDTLRAELQRDENVFLIGEEIGVFEGSYKITAGLLAEFGPRRVRDTPICEEGFTGVAIGAAMMGLRPVVEIMTINFSLLAIDQIVNNAAKLRSLSGGQVSVPLVIRTPGGGGQQLSATHSQNLEVFYAHVPGLKVVAPATCADAKGLLTAAIRDDDPVLVLENLALYNTKGEVPDGEHVAEIGRAAVIKLGRDVTIISNLGMYGIRQFTAVINPPQAAILAVGEAVRQPVARGDEVAVATIMTLTLSIDHRAVDGATGAGFLARLKELIEQPLDIVL